MRILFLDIDGVLTNELWSTWLATAPGTKYKEDLLKQGYITPLSPENISALNNICESIPDLEIHIVSSWIKLNQEDDDKSAFYKFIIKHLVQAGFQHVDKISEDYKQNIKQSKFERITNIMNANPDAQCLLLDDQVELSDMLNADTDTLIQCANVHINNEQGLSMNDVNLVCQYFGFDRQKHLCLF
jgi:hypothetical protein